MNIAKSIIEKIKKSNGYTQLELDTNVALNNFIKLIANEQKCNYIEGDGPEWEAKLYVINNEINGIDLEEVESILKTVLSAEKTKITSSETMYRFIANYFRPANGLGLRINKYIDSEGLLRFNAALPELAYIKENFFNTQGEIREDIFKKIMLPFYKKNNKAKTDEQKQKNVENTVIKFRKMLAGKVPEGLDEQVIAEYYIKDIVNLYDDSLIKNNSKSTSLIKINNHFNILEKIQDYKMEKTRLKNCLKYQSKMNLNKYVNNFAEFSHDLQILSNGIAAQVFTNSQDLAGKDKQQVQDVLKQAYHIYTEHETDNSFQVSESGYRTRNVAAGGRDIYLHKENGQVETAMDNLSEQIVSLVKNSDKMSNEDYIKEVARLHFRYILIHPFRDSNGRTGRNLINLLLNQKEMMFILPKNNKTDYLHVMNKCMKEVDLHEYSHSLAYYPEELQKFEEPICENLGGFIKENCYNYSDDAVKMIDDKSMERYYKGNSMSPKATSDTPMYDARKRRARKIKISFGDVFQRMLT